jgi:SAM-dependent methyltransferase
MIYQSIPSKEWIWSARELPFEAEEFDFVFSKSVIEHLNDPHFFLKGVHDALKPGGKAVIMTPSWSHTYWGPFYIDHTHVSPYTKFSLKTVLEMSGFKNVKVVYFYQLPFLWKHPWLVPFAQLFAKLPIPYSPYNDVPWKTSNWLNKACKIFQGGNVASSGGEIDD